MKKRWICWRAMVGLERAEQEIRDYSQEAEHAPSAETPRPALPAPLPASEGQSLRDVAHDLNNRLGVISFANLLLANLEEGGENQEDDRVILNAADEAAGLTEKISQ